MFCRQSLRLCQHGGTQMFKHLQLSKMKKLTTFVPSASLFSFTKKRVRYEAQYKRDGIDPKQKLVYVSNMKNYVMGGALLVPVSVILTTGSALQAVVKSYQMPEFPANISADQPVFVAPLLIGFGVFIWLAMNKCRRQIIQRIYFDQNKDTYTAVLFDPLLRSHKIQFKPGEVQSIQPKFTNIWTNILIHGKHYFLLPNDFRMLRHYNHMMGWGDHQ